MRVSSSSSRWNSGEYSGPPMAEHLFLANKHIYRLHHLLRLQLHHQCSHPLPLQGLIMMIVNAQMGSRVTASTHMKILMSARKGLHVNAKNANARTHGEAMSAAAVEACFT